MHRIGLKPPETFLIVGEPLLDCDELHDCLKSVDIHIPVVQHGNIEKNEVTWCRDLTVSTLDGTQILGYRGLCTEEISHFVAISPPISNNLGFNLFSKAVGKGIQRSEEETQKVIDFMIKYKIPFRQSHCAFDGGNLLLSYDSKNKPRAIIGFHQVVLTYIALKVQGFYEKNAHRLNFNPIPSEEAYYAARNQDLWFKNINLAVSIQRTLTDELSMSIAAQCYLSELFSHLTVNQKMTFHQRAIDFERKFQIAKEEIGKELGIKNLVFIPNREFHIDMDLLPINGKEIVFVHDDQEVILQSLTRKVRVILLDHGLIPRPVIGIERCNGVTLNLMNVLHFKDALVIPTSLPGFERIDREFIEALKRENLKIARIRLPRDTITLFNGGLHCFTMVAQSPVYSQMIKNQPSLIEIKEKKFNLRDVCPIL